MDWVDNWKRIVDARATRAGTHPDPGYWNRRAPSFARSTQARADEFLKVIERLEWVTAVEPSEGMRSMIAAASNMTIVASTWEDAEVAPADLVICSHVLYGVSDIEPFIAKLERSARERVFIMLRESDLPHPAAAIRKRLEGDFGPPMPCFSDLFMLLVQLGIAPDVKFLRYQSVTRYANLDEALVDARALVGDGWDEAIGHAMLDELLTRENGELVFDGGTVLSGVAHWQPRS
jgi:hypothetical protein